MIFSLDEDGLKLGNPPALLPCLCRSVSVGSRLIFDTAATEGTNGQKYQLKGWEDGDIAINIVILGDSNESMTQKLETIVNLFKKTDNSGAPIIYEIDMPVLKAWKINRTFYSGLRTNQTIGKQKLECSLTFREYKPEIDTIQENKRFQEQEAAKTFSLPEMVEPYLPGDVSKLKNLVANIRKRGL